MNVATGGYYQGQERLELALKQFNRLTQLLPWNDPLPVNWPTHAERPYAFKAYAMEEAAQESGLLLWCDASIVPIRPLDRLWEKIEKDGYWIALNGWRNYDWTCDSAYPDLFPGMKLEQARELNKRIPHVVATAFGLNLKHPTGRECLRQYYALAQTKAFCGPWKNDPANPCGPPDVLGHRHDQTALSVIAWRLGMELTECPNFFAYQGQAEPHPETILLAVGI